MRYFGLRISNASQPLENFRRVSGVSRHRHVSYIRALHLRALHCIDHHNILPKMATRIDPLEKPPPHLHYLASEILDHA